MIRTVSTKHLSLKLSKQTLMSLTYDGKELLADTQPPLFEIRLRDKTHGTLELSSWDTENISISQEGQVLKLTYIFECPALTVVFTVSGGEQLTFRINIENQGGEHGYAVEYVDFPSVKFADAMKKQNGKASVLWPYNEGVIVDDALCKPELVDPEYPSLGNYPMFPYMIFSQFSALLLDGFGIYMGAHDAKYAPKAIDFACEKQGIRFRTRVFCGGDYGQSIPSWFETVWNSFEGDWHDAADLYRLAFSETLQPSLAKVTGNPRLPAWYRDDMPLVLTYPVRGIHDMDEMTPNGLFPYKNVLPYVEEFAERTGCRIMVLLMHWEGTAPWAPPYVWPPYGGETMFREFMEKIHARGDLLGVYCSGLGFTEQSNLIAEYNCTDLIKERKLEAGMCLAPDQSLQYSRICRAQRSGYDICSASEVGREVLNEALSPLLTSGVDYIQALDQNHGGTMYFCYADKHGHAPTPGAWMTKATGKLLEEWKEMCPNTLLGCESAAAEPHLGVLALSDNRYELCYFIGRPVPLYSYLFHPYLHNFMGNQVSSPLGASTEALIYRLAYSFLAGDLLTLVLDDVGDVMANWGMRDFSKKPDKDAVIAFCADANVFHRRYPDLFRGGVMKKPVPMETSQRSLYNAKYPEYMDDAVLTTAWEYEDGTVQLLANYTDEVQIISLSFADETRVRIIEANGNQHEITGHTIELSLSARSIVAVEF